MFDKILYEVDNNDMLIITAINFITHLTKSAIRDFEAILPCSKHNY
jgi:hypothetical protein